MREQILLPRSDIDISTPTDCLSAIVVCAACLSLSWPAIILRFFTKWRVVQHIGWDDWMILISNMFFTVYCSSVIAISRRVDTSEKYIQPGDLLVSMNLLTVAEIFYIITLLALKISLGIIFLRFTVLRWQRRVIYIAVTVSTLFSIAIFFFAVFQCGYYKGALGFIYKRLQNECTSDSSALGMTYTHGTITTLTDWTFLLMPFFILRRSLTTRRQKWTVGIVLGFASLSGIASFIRFKYIDGFAVPKQDFFVNARNIAIWSCVEPGIGIIAGSFVTIRPLIRRIQTPSLDRKTAYQDIEWRSLPDAKDTSKEAPLELPQNQPQVPAYVAAYQNEKDRQLGSPWIVNFFRSATNGTKPKESGLPLDIFGTNALNTESDEQDRDVESLRLRWRATPPEEPSISEKQVRMTLPEEHSKRDKHVRASRGRDKPLPPIPRDLPRRSLRWSHNPPHLPPPPLPQAAYAPRGSKLRSPARQHLSPAMRTSRKDSAIPPMSPDVPAPARRRNDDGRSQRWDYVFNSLTKTPKQDPAFGLDIFGSSIFPSQSDLDD